MAQPAAAVTGVSPVLAIGTAVDGGQEVLRKAVLPEQVSYLAVPPLGGFLNSLGHDPLQGALQAAQNTRTLLIQQHANLRAPLLSLQPAAALLHGIGIAQGTALLQRLPQKLIVCHTCEPPPACPARFGTALPLSIRAAGTAAREPSGPGAQMGQRAPRQPVRPS